MKLADYKHCFLIEGIFPAQISAGFTKNSLPGNLPQDINTALYFFNQQLEVAYLNQIHSAKVLSVNQGGCYEGDALFTKSSGLVLVVKTADCLPLIFESKELGVIGAVHMGWRSARAGILDNIPYDLNSFKVVAGVGLRGSCYEVEDEFLSHESFKPFIEKAGSKFYFNPIEFAKNRLAERGLKKDNFVDLDICSFCSPNKFSSCRRDKIASRTLSFILKM